MKYLFLILIVAAAFGGYLYKPEESHAAFSYVRTITIDYTKVATVNSTDQVNFPVLVSGTYSYLATTANGGNVQNSSGYDVGFYSSSDCVTGKLNWETEIYTAATGVVVYWVKIPTVSASVDTLFYMCYGDSSISTDRSSATSVWDSNYKQVLHLPNGTTLSGTDSTSNGNNGTASSTVATGLIDGGSTFSGTNDVITDSLSLSKTTGTISHWLNSSSLRQMVALYESSGTGSTFDGFGDPASQVEIHTSMQSSSLWGFFYQDGTNGASSSFSLTGGTPVSGQWAYVVATWDTSGSAYLYVNGVQVASTIISSKTFASVAATTHQFGHVGLTTNTARSWNGLLDELRISSTARSADWVKTEYNNQNSPSTFYTITATASTPATKNIKIRGTTNSVNIRGVGSTVLNSITRTALGTNQFNGSASSITISNVTLSTGDSLVVGTGCRGTAAPSVSTITWGATNLSLENGTTNGTTFRVEEWSLHNVTGGTNTVTITWSAACTTNQTAFATGLRAMSGVLTSGTNAIGTGSTNPAITSSSITCTPNTNAQCIWVTSLIVQRTNADAEPTWGIPTIAGQKNGTTASNAQYISEGYEIDSGALTQAESATMATAGVYATVMVNYKSAASTVITTPVKFR